MSGAGHSSGQNDHLSVGAIDLRQKSVGTDLDSMCAPHGKSIAHGNGGHGNARTAEKIHGSQGFDLFKSFGKKQIDHTKHLSYTYSSDTDHARPTRCKELETEAKAFPWARGRALLGENPEF